MYKRQVSASTAIGSTAGKWGVIFYQWNIKRTRIQLHIESAFRVHLMFFTCEPTSSQKWFWKRTRFVPPRLTTSMHRQRASMGCRHSAPVDPIDASTDAIRPKLLPPSRHGSVIPTARDPLASIGQQSKLPRRSSLSSVGRLGRAAGAPQSRTEFDAALTAKLERCLLYTSPSPRD